MTKRDIIDVRAKHPGGRPKGKTEASRKIDAMIESAAKLRSLDHPKALARGIFAQLGRQYRTTPGPNAGWRVNPMHTDLLAELIAKRLRLTPAQLNKYPARVTEELDRLLNDPESRNFYFEFEPDLEFDGRKEKASERAILEDVKRFKRKQAGSKAKSPKP